MKAKTAVRWALSIVSLLTVTIVAFIPILVVLVQTPLHNGDDVPSMLVLSVSAIASAALGGLLALLIYRLSYWTRDNSKTYPQRRGQ
ncbi:MAG TPA: hypothetical protein VIV60_14645 [Polyangiaceae bacterium]